jgi:hypothetical protein
MPDIKYERMLSNKKTSIKMKKKHHQNHHTMAFTLEPRFSKSTSDEEADDLENDGDFTDGRCKRTRT